MMSITPNYTMYAVKHDTKSTKWQFQSCELQQNAKNLSAGA